MPSDHLATELREKIERLEEVRDDLSSQIESMKESLEAAADSSLPPKTQFLKIAEFLLKHDNTPRSSGRIMRATGISRASLSQILHRTNKSAFVSHPIPGFSRKKRWSLTGAAADEATRVLRRYTAQAGLFGPEGEFAGMKIVDCCVRILKDHGNEPMNALTMAREAIARGYRGYRVRGSEDEVLLTTAKSLWAALGRDERFTEVRPLVFGLKPQGT